MEGVIFPFEVDLFDRNHTTEKSVIVINSNSNNPNDAVCKIQETRKRALNCKEEKEDEIMAEIASSILIYVDVL